MIGGAYENLLVESDLRSGPRNRLLRKPNSTPRRGTESERFEIPEENAVVRFKVKQYNALR